MNTKSSISNSATLTSGQESASPLPFPIENRKSKIVNLLAFSLVEVLLVVSLLSLIVLALMNVFSATQAAFRASITQTDVLEGSRAAMQLITSDLRAMTPSGGVSNVPPGSINCPVNFFVQGNSFAYAPLLQNLPGSSIRRTNLLNYFFSLGRQNQKWIGVGYIVDTTSSSPLYPLYRFYRETNTTTSPQVLYNQFVAAINNAQWTNLSHVMDGVVHLVVRATDTNGVWINSYYTNAQNLYFYPFGLANSAFGESQFFMLSNTVPASVELQFGVLEDRPLARAESLPFRSLAQSNYLAQQAGKVHLFRQVVPIPNVDPTAYQ